MRRLLFGRRDEKGAVLLMTSVGIVVAVIAAALAVDLGFVAQERRSDQKVADLAALDAVRDTSNAQALAEASAARNGFAIGGDNTLLAEVGSVDAGNVFTAGVGDTAVRVTVSSKHDYLLSSDARTVTARAVASTQAIGGFSIGSSLVTIDTARSKLLNGVVGGMIGAPALSLSLASWQGLATGRVTLEALRVQLVSMGFSVGTLDELLDANLTAAQFFQAQAQALTLAGDTANAAVMNILRIAVTSTATFKLSDMIEVAQGGDSAALAAQMNVLQLVTGSASVINGTNLVSVPDVGVTVPGVLETALSLKVLEGPKFYFGPVGGPSVTTGQIDLTLSPNLNLNVLGLLTVTGSFPVRIQAAGATGTLTAATCGGSPGITVTADPIAFSGSVAATLTVRSLLGPILEVPTTNVLPSIDGGPTDLVWSYPAEFPPPDGTTTSKHAGSEPVGLQTLTNITVGTPVVLGSLPLPVGTIVSAVLAAVTPLLGTVDNSVLTPLLTALGIDIGGADVTALTLQCESPVLVG